MGTDSTNVIGMKKVLLFIFFLSVCLVSLNSCGENDYVFVCSRQGELFIKDPNNVPTLDDMLNMRNGSKPIYVGVDIYRKKAKGDGFYDYMVKNQDGIEYKVIGSVKPNNNSILVVNDFRHQNYIGILHVRP